MGGMRDERNGEIREVKTDPDTERFKKLLSVIFYVCENAGFHIEERMIIKDLRTGKVYR